MTNKQFKQTETRLLDGQVCEIPEKWSLTPFGKVASLSKDIFDPKKAKQDENSVYLGLEHFCEGGFALNGVGQSNEIQSNKFRFVSGDVLFGKLRPYFKKVYSPKFNGVCSTDIWVLRAKPGIDQKFLYFLVGSDIFLNKAIESSEGTKMPRASWDFIANHKFPIPFFDEQQQIASIFTSLDDKIELNRKMNKILEEIGKALFKRWFVDFEFPDDNGKPYKSSGGKMVDSELGEIPEGWRVGKLKDLIKITSGKRPKVKVDNKTEDYNVPIVGASGIMGYTSGILYDEKIIVTGRVGTLGVVRKIEYPCWISDNVLVIQSEYHEYVYGILSAINYSTLNVGSTQPLVTQSAIKDLDIVIPRKLLLQKFELIVGSLTQKIKSNNEETEISKGVRDSLLPRLMCGKIRVN